MPRSHSAFIAFERFSCVVRDDVRAVTLNDRCRAVRSIVSDIACENRQLEVCSVAYVHFYTLRLSRCYSDSGQCGGTPT